MEQIKWHIHTSRKCKGQLSWQFENFLCLESTKECTNNFSVHKQILTDQICSPSISENALVCGNIQESCFMPVAFHEAGRPFPEAHVRAKLSPFDIDVPSFLHIAFISDDTNVLIFHVNVLSADTAQTVNCQNFPKTTRLCWLLVCAWCGA